MLLSQGCPLPAPSNKHTPSPERPTPTHAFDATERGMLLSGKSVNSVGVHPKTQRAYLTKLVRTYPNPLPYNPIKRVNPLLYPISPICLVMEGTESASRPPHIYRPHSLLPRIDSLMGSPMSYAPPLRPALRTQQKRSLVHTTTESSPPLPGTQAS